MHMMKNLNQMEIQTQQYTDFDMIESLIFGLIILTITSLWVLIEQRKNPKFLIWFIPLLLVLVSSTYVTYTSILGKPRVEIPKEGLYLKHYIAEPNWIYLWVLEKDNVPISYKFAYSKEAHRGLEGVEEKSIQGDYMMLKEIEEEDGQSDGDSEEEGSGYTVGGKVGFYKWDYTKDLPPKVINN